VTPAAAAEPRTPAPGGGTPLVIGVDLGTGGPKVMLAGVRGEVAGLESASVPTRILPGGGAEQDPDDWWRAIAGCVRRLLAAHPGASGQVAAICFSSQWGGTVPVDGQGRATHPALIWLDGRGARYAQAVTGGWPGLPGSGYNPRKLRSWVSKTGGAPTRTGQDPVGQSLWLAHQRPQAYAAARYLLDIPEYLTMRASGRAVTAADTAVLRWCSDNRDPRHVRWDRSLAAMAGLDLAKLPEIVTPASVVGTLTSQAADDLGLPAGVRVIAGTGDTTAAALGAGAVGDYVPHLYVGTSAWLTCHVPRKKTDVFRNIAAMPSVVPGRYWVATMQNVAGKAVDWLVDNLLDQHGPARSKEAMAELNALAAASPPGSRGVIFTPWLNGERTPVDDRTVRGGWLNLSLDTRREDLARAVFEGVSYNARWMLGAVEHFTGRTGPAGLGAIRFIGGAATSRLWCQAMADILNRPICQVAQPAAANARGAALLAAIAIGAVGWQQVPGLVQVSERFEPNDANRGVYDAGYAAFRLYYRGNRGFYARLNGARLNSTVPGSTGALRKARQVQPQ
jgi:xylulokinase